VLVAAVPLFDAVFATIRRIRSRTSVLNGDRRHGYDLLAARDWSIRKIALSVYIVTGAFSAVGYYVLKNPSPRALVAAAIEMGLFVCVAIRLGSLRADASNTLAETASGQSMNREFS
jgi:UDP-GlcNAc:undecaprenyl-phosphate GlcNAc-1-phosphate transferase